MGCSSSKSDTGAKSSGLHYVVDNSPAVMLPLEKGCQYHLYLSHLWKSGQDPIRIVKHLLRDMLPGVRAFLDVDDLAFGTGIQDLDHSLCVAIFLTAGYLESKNTMRELLRAVMMKKHIIVIMEPDEHELSREAIKASLVKNEQERYAKWKFDEEVKKWQEIDKTGPLPSHHVIFDAIFAHEVIEWNRNVHFQAVTTRLIASRLIEPRGDTYTPAELTHQRIEHAIPKLVTPTKYHVYASPHNPGAADLMVEVALFRIRGRRTVRGQLLITERREDISESDAILIYLTSKTWADPSGYSKEFAEDVKIAIDAGCRLILAHEVMSPVIVNDTRDACTFDHFFLVTPHDLINQGLYREVALPLKAGAYRDVSLTMLAMKLSEKLAQRKSRISSPSKEHHTSLKAAVHPTKPQLVDDALELAREAEEPLLEESTWSTRGGAELEAHLAATTIVDATWLLKLAKGEVMPERAGVVPAWQQLPPEAKLHLTTLRKTTMDSSLPVAVLSYGWAAQNHPDPTGALLRKLMPVFEAMAHSCKYGTGAGGRPTAWGIVWDFMSLPQRGYTSGYDKDRDDRSPYELARFAKGLKSINVWYAHQHVVTLVADLPMPTGAVNPAPIDRRGWCIFERQLSSLRKDGYCCLQLSGLSRVEGPRWWHIVKVCVAGRRAPQTPEAFEAMMWAGMADGSIKFTNGKDATEICIPQYREGFVRLMQQEGDLRFGDCGWGDAEVRELVASLQFAHAEGATSQARQLDLVSNKLTVTATNPLIELLASGAVPKLRKLWLLDNKEMGVSTEEIFHLKDAGKQCGVDVLVGAVNDV